MKESLNRKKIILGLIAADKRIKSVSVNRFSDNLAKAIKERFLFLEFSPENFKNSREAELALEEFAKRVDLILELPRVYSPFSYSLPVPTVSFTSGFFLKPNLHLPELWNLLWPNNSLVFSCRAELEIFKRIFNHSRQMAYLLHWPVDTTVFKPRGKRQAGEIGQRIGLKADEFLLLYAGRIIPEKNIHTLLKIFRQVLRFFPNSRLCIAGKANDFLANDYRTASTRINYFKDLKRLVSRYALERKVVFIEHLGTEELVSLYSAADVFVNCTVYPYENFGYGQVEAMACATPVVCSAWGGLKDTVIDSVTGYLMDTLVTDEGPKVDWQRGAQRIISIFKDAKLRQKLSENSLKHARKAFSLKNFGEKLEDIVFCSLERKRNVKNYNQFKKVNPQLMDIYLGYLYKGILAERHCACDNKYNFKDKKELYYDNYLLASYSSAAFKGIVPGNESIPHLCPIEN